MSKKKIDKIKSVSHSTHRAGLRSNSCHKCGYSPSSLARLKTHIEKCLFCSICKSKFMSEKKYLQHSCEKLKCDKCFRVFKNRPQYDKHFEECVLKYQCQWCKKKYSNQVI